jgi:ketosteroid isomerase-like protein
MSPSFIEKHRRRHGAIGAHVRRTNERSHKGQGMNRDETMDETITVETLKHILEAFNRHDLNAIMTFFSDDCSFDFPKGPEPWGQRFIGKDRVREALATRFKGIPDVHYGDDRHWVAGDMGVSEWTLTGTTASGAGLRVRGCDHWEFRKGKVVRKDSYWKIVEH